MDKKISPEGLEAFLVKAYKLTSEDLASLYNEAGELTNYEFLETKDSERVKKLSENSTKQYNRGIKEGAEKLERAIKEKYEVESELIGVELFDSIIETKVADIKKADPTEVLKHPEVIKLLNEKDKALKAKDKEKEEAITAIRDQIENENLLKEVESSAIIEFDNLKPILPEDAKKAKAQKEFFLRMMKEGKSFQKTENGYIVKDKDGNPLKDQHGYDVTFTDYIKGVAEGIFDFKKAEERSSSGNQNQSGTSSGSKVRMPKDQADFVKMIQDQTLTAEERVKIGELWKTKKQ